MAFHFISALGKGRYSSVWKAKDSKTEEVVAVKMIAKEHTSRRGYKRELKFSKTLGKHVNFGAVWKRARETDTHYLLIQEFAVGGDLCDYIMLHGKVEESPAKCYFSQIRSAIQHMHSLDMVHLDIKPDNILLKDTYSCSVVLTDFGLTRRTGKKLSVACGTMPYMAPENFNENNNLPICHLVVKPSLDVWSLGVVLLCMLTGTHPWGQAVKSDLDYLEFYQWQTEEPSCSLPPQGWEEFSPSLCGLLEGLLAIDPKRRCKGPPAGDQHLQDNWLLC